MSFPPYNPGRQSVKTPAKRFTVQPTISGYEIIDFDCRPVATRDFQHEADGVAADLNRAAFGGSLDLAATLAVLS